MNRARDIAKVDLNAVPSAPGSVGAINLGGGDEELILSTICSRRRRPRRYNRDREVHMHLLAQQLLRSYLVRAAAISCAAMELEAALVEQVFQMVETAPRDGGNGMCIFGKAIDDVEAPVLGPHLFGQLLDDVDVETQAARSVAGGEHHGWCRHEAALLSSVAGCQFHGRSSSILLAG